MSDQHCQLNHRIMYRGRIPVYYSTQTGTSKKIAQKFRQDLEKEHFSAPLINVGDYHPDSFTEHQGTVIMFLSTFGRGEPADDAQEFFVWVESLIKSNQNLDKLNFILFALGSTNFAHYCQSGQLMRKFLTELKAKELMPMEMSDSSSKARNVDRLYPDWSAKSLDVLKGIYPLKEMDASDFVPEYRITFSEQKIQDWKTLSKSYKNLGKEFLMFQNSSEVQVDSIKELRNDGNGKQILWVRLKKPEDMVLKPGCNLSIYPMNILKKQTEIDQLSVFFQTTDQMNKVPYPPMPFRQLRKLANLSGKSTKNFIADGLSVSRASSQLIQKYRSIVNSNEEVKQSNDKVIEELKLDEEFITKVGMNIPRTYNLAGWDDKYIDLLVSTIEGGLTSEYLKSNPSRIHVISHDLNCEIPQNRPIVMISHGIGIAPFRSVSQYLKTLPQVQRNSAYMYHGCRTISQDFYFKQEWKQLEQNGVLQIKIAESRKSPQQRKYVQDILKEDRELLRKHLFQNQGVVFICGGPEMVSEAQKEMFEVCKLEQKVPFKAYKKYKDFMNHRKIISQVFL